MTRVALLAITLGVAAIIALAGTYPDLMIGPGHLSEGHAALATNCFGCHTPFRGASSQRCTNCHSVADIGLRTTKGVPLANDTQKTSFHRDLTVEDCVACHSEHVGLFPTRSRKLFRHELLQASKRERCEGCHAAPKSDFHANFTAKCMQCHGLERWKPASFDHSRFFKLDSNHNANCATCHPGTDFKQFTCYGCHAHNVENVRREHMKEGIVNFENCVRCHRSAHE